MDVRTLGIDLVKNLFQVHGVDGQDRTVVQRQLRRRQTTAICGAIATLLGGDGACGGLSPSAWLADSSTSGSSWTSTITIA